MSAASISIVSISVKNCFNACFAFNLLQVMKLKKKQQHKKQQNRAIHVYKRSQKQKILLLTETERQNFIWRTPWSAIQSTSNKIDTMCNLKQ